MQCDEHMKCRMSLTYGRILKGIGNKTFIVSFERDSETIHGSRLQNFKISFNS